MNLDRIRQPRNTFCGRTARREFLHQVGGGFTSLALSGLMSGDGFLQSQAVAADGATPWQNPLAYLGGLVLLVGGHWYYSLSSFLSSTS